MVSQFTAPRRASGNMTRGIVANSESSSSTTSNDTRQSRKRLKYIDVAKGIAILAVIIGHVAIRLAPLSRGAGAVVGLCFTFHMPLFFLLSGYFFHYERKFDWRKESRRLLLPYAITALVIVALQFIIALHSDELPVGMSPKGIALGWLNAAVYGSAALDGKELWPQQFRIGALWFLLALFWARLFVRIAYKTKLPVVVIICLTLCGALSAQYISLPFSIQAGLTATLYVYLGTVARKHDLLTFICKRPLVILPCIAIWLYAILRFNGFGLGLANFGITPPDAARNFIGSLAGMVVVLYSSNFIEHHADALCELLSNIGQLTLLILAIHIIDDDVSPIDAINGVLLSSGIGAFYLVIVESAVRCTVSVIVAKLLDRIPAVHKLFS